MLNSTPLSAEKFGFSAGTVRRRFVPKGNLPTLLSEAGRATVDCGRPLNTWSPIAVSCEPAAKVTEANEVLPLKDSVPRETKLAGKVTEVKRVFLKAEVPIV